MPVSAVIRTNPNLDYFAPGCQIIEDTGLITDAEGGFDQISLTILADSKQSIPPTGSTHPELGNMYLFTPSPQRLAGGYYRVQLTYKGLADLHPGQGGRIPTEGGDTGKFTYGMRMVSKTWAPGELTGSVPGLGDPTAYTVNVQEPQKTVKVAWVGTAPFSSLVFAVGPSGRSSELFTGIGTINESFYGSISNPAYNFPNGWVPIDANAEQVAPGKALWMNQVSFVGTPRYSPT